MSTPPEFDDSTLLAYLDGEVDDATAAAIAANPALQARAAALAAAEAQLRRGLYRVTCPPTLDLGEFALGLLAGGDAAVVADHVAHCPHCAAEVAQSRRYLAASSVLVDRLAQGVQSLLATLQDGGEAAPGLALGVRGGDAGPRLYEAGPYQISIEVQADGADRRALLGLLLDDGGETGWEAVLLQGDDVAATEPLDDLGNFAFHGLAAGSYALLLRRPGLLIQIPPLDV